jgi:hypothetical protein
MTSKGSALPSFLRARFITGAILRPAATGVIALSEVKTATRLAAEGIWITSGFTIERSSVWDLASLQWLIVNHQRFSLLVIT